MRIQLSQQAAELLGQSVFDHHRVGRRCGSADRSDGQDGLAGSAGLAYPPPLEATGAQLGLDGCDLAGV